MIFDILFLPVLFLIAALAVYQDFKQSIVSNRLIQIGLAWGFGVIFFLTAARWIFKPSGFFDFLSVSYNYVFFVLLNFVISLICGFLFWRFKLWGAGDAKLFAVYSLLLPLKYYSNSFMLYFPSFSLLLNIFVIALCFLLFKSLFYLYFKLSRVSFWDFLYKAPEFFPKLKIYFKDLKKKEALTRGLSSFLLIVSLSFLNLKINFLARAAALSIIVLFVVRHLFNLAMRYKKFSIYIFFTLLVLVGWFFAQYKNDLGINFFSPVLKKLLYNFTLFALIFGAIRMLLRFYAKLNFREEKMSFALVMFLGLVSTIILQGTVISYLISLK